ncbi:anhydro-N-acetylmuramic acid kinase [Paucibacter sp. APW11]|uniref:Anhydro-N-acetylmuramic acid kinase n=1 Tax=Roseateles aquae TaxID=3077235 RepID=A0ABU3PHY1_9BURK|nr:anhydro-N-acetylmuramic acid kinase [Paucibacter sp. APW11]MDT9002184.1 anhydro-N-acetylmuramic acid kinase [Paucibacter sp. APW11]
MPAAEHFIGLMSGTSLDGVDGVIARFPEAGGIEVIAHQHQPFPAELRAELLALNSSGADELRRAALAGNALARSYAALIERLRAEAPQADIRAIGAHGQTVRHQPGSGDGIGFTCQLLNGALLAELSCIDVVCDLRSRDVAAGGQGAPLVPAFHQAVFAQPERAVAVLNIGGISNVSLLGESVSGFDCGPGNCLMDHWVQRHLGHQFDADGAWARQGQVLPELLQTLLGEPFFSQAPPRSTGRDLFNPAWLQARLERHAAASAVDVQATLLALTAHGIAGSLQQQGWSHGELLVCGGGAFNGALLDALQALLPGMQLMSSGLRGLPPMQVEAAAFAWLAERFIRRLPGNLPAVTGAAGTRLLGALYPA